MKIYMFFRIVKGLTPILYAFTNDKEYYDAFKNERDMNKFIIQKKEIKDDDYDKFADKYKGCVLGRRGYLTKPPSSDYLGKRYHLKIVSTWDEEMTSYMQSESVYHFLSKYTDPIASYFNKDLLKALNTLGYFNVMKFTNPELNFLDGIHLRDKLMDIDYEVDMFSVFNSLYGNTFRKDIK
jgi:hypothetical protein